MAADEARTARLVQRDEAVIRATSAGKSGGARSNLVKYAYDHLFPTSFVLVSIVLSRKTTHSLRTRISVGVPGLGAFGVSLAVG